MIAYSRSLDETIDNGKKMPHWMSRSSEKASNYLSRYGLDKSFFENKLQEQHKLEKECNTIEALSAPSSEILSKIFGAIGELTHQTGYSSNLEKLGFELGKLIYVYDGLLDFQKDTKAGIFNCLSACYLNQDKDMRRISIEIFDFIENTRNNISSILKNIEFEKNDNLIKRIFLQDFEIREINNKQNILHIFKEMKSTCGTGITVSKETIYDIMSGKMVMKFVQDDRATCTETAGLVGCLMCCPLYCGGHCCAQRCREKEIDKARAKDDAKLSKMSEKELLIEIAKRGGR